MYSLKNAPLPSTRTSLLISMFFLGFNTSSTPMAFLNSTWPYILSFLMFESILSFFPSRRNIKIIDMYIYIVGEVKNLNVILLPS